MTTPKMLARAPFEGGRRRISLGWSETSVQMVVAFGLLVLVTGVYSVLYDSQQHSLPGTYEWTSVADTALPLVFAGLAQGVVVITGGLDLSIGGMIDIANAIVAIDMRRSPGSMLLWCVVVLAIGAGGGMVNGLFVSRVRIPPILVTLATLSIFQGIAIWVLPTPGGTVPVAFTNILTNPSVPWSFAWIGAVMVAWLVFRRTRLCANMYAIGNDQRAAHSRGIRVNAVTVKAYMLSGCLAAAAGIFLAATSTSGDATSGTSFVLTSIAAVVVGGLTLAGGRGSPLGVVAGALALTILESVLFFAHVTPLYVDLYEGLFLIAAVLLAAVLNRLWEGTSVDYR